MTGKDTSAWQRHHHRPDLVGEHPRGDAGQLILFLVFMTVWILDSFILRWTTRPAAWIPLWLRLSAGAVLLAVSFILARRSLGMVFGQERPEPRVISSGVYARVRHPMYLAVLLFYLSLIVFTLSLAAFMLWIPAVIFYHLIARYEEKLLVEALGTSYLSYRHRVPMWFPRPGKP